MDEASIFSVLNDRDFAFKVALEYKKRTGYSNLLGNTLSNMRSLLPIILFVLASGLHNKEEQVPPCLPI
jgi:hypothetical protein